MRMIDMCASRNRHILALEQPAIRWEDALPSGNGRIGAMVYGNIHRETVLINHEAFEDYRRRLDFRGGEVTVEWTEGEKNAMHDKTAGAWGSPLCGNSVTVHSWDHRAIISDAPSLARLSDGTLLCTVQLWSREAFRKDHDVLAESLYGKNRCLVFACDLNQDPLLFPQPDPLGE